MLHCLRIVVTATFVAVTTISCTIPSGIEEKEEPTAVEQNSFPPLKEMIISDPPPRAEISDGSDGSKSSPQRVELIASDWSALDSSHSQQPAEEIDWTASSVRDARKNSYRMTIQTESVPQ